MTQCDVLRKRMLLAAGGAALALLLAAGPARVLAAEGQAAGDEDAAVQLPTVSVSGEKVDEQDGTAKNGYRAGTATAGPLGKTAIKDTPYSINVTPGELFENRLAHTRADALATNPTVSSLMESNGYCSMTRVMIRGFSASDQNDMRDGMTDRSWTVFPLENVDRIEVLNGMSGFLYGFSNPGGAVNYITKQPTATPLYSAETGLFGGGVFYGHADVGGPVAGTDGKLSYRVNLYKESGDTFVKDSDQRRGFYSGIMKYQFSPGTFLSVDAWHQDFSLNGVSSYIDVSPTAGIDVPKASNLSARKQYGQSWTYNHSSKSVAGTAFESKLNDIFTLRTAYRYGNMWRRYKWVKIMMTDNDGNYMETASNTPRQYETTHSGYALLDSDFGTWALKHHVTFGYTGTNFTFRRGDDVSTVLGASNTSSPSDYVDPGLQVGTINKIMHQAMNNFVGGDRIDLTDSLSLLAGVNHAMYSAYTKSSSPYHTFQTANTPSLGLIFKPRRDLSFYTSYIEGLANGGTAPSTAANSGAILDPAVSKQYEVGTKATIGRADMTLALFRIDKVNEFTDPSDNTYKQDGREIHQGVEFITQGKVTDNLTLVGGFTLMDAHVSKAQNGSLENKVPINVPERQARLYAEYRLPFAPDFTITGGGFYNGKRYVDAYNLSSMDESVIFDTGLRYQTKAFDHDLLVNLVVKNVFDTAYWSYYNNGSGLFLGDPRTIALSLKYTW